MTLGNLVILPLDIRRLIYRYYPGKCARLSKKILMEVQPIITAELDGCLIAWEINLLAQRLRQVAETSGYNLNNMEQQAIDKGIGLGARVREEDVITSLSMWLCSTQEYKLIFKTDLVGKRTFIVIEPERQEDAGFCIRSSTLLHFLGNRQQIRANCTIITHLLQHRHGDRIRAQKVASRMARDYYDILLAQTGTPFGVDELAACFNCTLNEFLLLKTPPSSQLIIKSGCVILRDIDIHSRASVVLRGEDPYYTFLGIKDMLKKLIMRKSDLGFAGAWFGTYEDVEIDAIQPTLDGMHLLLTILQNVQKWIYMNMRRRLVNVEIVRDNKPMIVPLVVGDNSPEDDRWVEWT